MAETFQAVVPEIELFEVAIVGAGPAGIAAAIGAATHKMSHVLFEKGHVANTIYEYQKHKLVMAEPRKLPLRARVPFAEGSRETILGEFEKGITDAGVNVIYAEVKSIKKVGDLFEIKHGDQITRAKSVVLSIGLQGTPRKLGVPGEELPHVAYTLSDPDAFKGRNILVVGAGDAAIENAMGLAPHNNVAILNRTNEFSRAKDGNNKNITEAIETKKVRCFSDANVKRIEPDRVFIESANGEVEYVCDHIIVRAGAILPRKFLESCGIKLPSDKPDAVPTVDTRYQSNVPGLYLLGALIGYPLIKQAMNQGYEVIEHILGHDVEPADAVLIKERLEHLPGKVEDNYEMIKAGTPIFSGLSEPQLREMLIDSTVHLKKPGDVIFERLDYTDTFWSVVYGGVDIVLPDKRLIHLKEGNFFGELGLISGRRRSATVVASEPSILLETPRKQMLKLMASVETVKRQLDESFMLRSLETTIFPEADPKALADLVHRVQLRQFKKGEVLFKQGDPGDALHVIRKGSVKISRKDATGVDITRTYLAAGNYVGEMALLADEILPRNATVTAVVGCETIVISKADFRALIDSGARVKSRVMKVAEARHIEGLSFSNDRQQGAVLDFMFTQGITDASNVLVIDSDLCVGCDNCESACAATHEGESRLDRKGGKFFAAVQVPISCRHCENPLCMTECPPDALNRAPDGEVVIRDSCIGCGKCVSNCPYGVIKLTHPPVKSPGGIGFSLLEWFGLKKPQEGPARAAKCDMCSKLPKGPACVRACPTGAAIRINPAELDTLMRRKGGMA